MSPGFTPAPSRNALDTGIICDGLGLEELPLPGKQSPMGINEERKAISIDGASHRYPRPSSEDFDNVKWWRKRRDHANFSSFYFHCEFEFLHIADPAGELAEKL